MSKQRVETETGNTNKVEATAKSAEEDLQKCEAELRQVKILPSQRGVSMYFCTSRAHLNATITFERGEVTIRRQTLGPGGKLGQNLVNLFKHGK